MNDRKPPPKMSTVVARPIGIIGCSNIRSEYCRNMSPEQQHRMEDTCVQKDGVAFGSYQVSYLRSGGGTPVAIGQQTRCH